MSSSYNLSEKDSSHYEDGYAIFLKRSDFRDKVISKFAELATETFTGRSEASVLDVGCGNGQMTLRYINELKRLITNVELTLLEPAENSIEEAVKILKPAVSNIIRTDKLPFKITYDLIITSYVFYHLPPDAIGKIANKVESGGVMAIMMGTNEHPLKSHPDLISVSKHGSSDNLVPFLDVLRMSSDYEIKRHKFETNLNLHGLWIDGIFSEDAKKLLSFSLNQNFEDLPKKALNAISDIFGATISSRESLLKSVHEIIWIKRIR